MNILAYVSILFFSVLSTPAYAEYHSIETTMHWGNQVNSRGFKEPKFYHYNYSNHDTWNNTPTGSAYSHQKYFNKYNVQDFYDHFIAHGYTEKEVLQQRSLYMFDEFVKFAQTYLSYKSTIQQLHAELKNLNIIQKGYYILTGAYCPGLQKRIHYLYNQLSTLKNEGPTHKQLIIKKHSFETFPEYYAEYKDLGDIYCAYTPSLSHAINKRVDAFKDMTKGGYSLQYISKSYNLSNNVTHLLDKHGYDTTSFTQCYGHQLHHIIHQESLDILNRIDALLHSSMLHDHQEALIDFTIAMVDYNHENLTDKAMQIGDLCWTLLDYGQAVAEGTALGVYSAATDIINNPIQATISIVVGKQVLTYQLCKVLYNVADIGITAISNLDNAKEKWNKYAEPLNNIIDAIYRKEITVRDVIKGGSAFVVGYKAQGKLLGGLGKFCNTIKQNAVRFAQNNVSSFAIQEYLATPEGYLLRSVAKTSCTASCPNQYDNLKQWLKIKEFTSILKTSRHGIERLIERDFTPKEVETLIKTPSFVKIQNDGALAYVKQIGEKFNIIVFNEHTEEVVTALKNTTQKKLTQMGKNYGWK